MKKILITGGHPTPAYALIEELEGENLEIYFIGRKRHVEGSTKISPELANLPAEIKFLPITTGRLQRRFTIHTIPSLLKIPIGFLQSFFYLLTTRPNIVVSFGSYVSTPVIVTAWLLGIPSITHEQATRVGLANKINSIFTREFYSAWPIDEIPDEKVIGNPTRKAIFINKASSQKVKKILNSGKKIIYVTGGSIGAHAINKVIFEISGKLTNFSVIHQIGTADYKGDHQKAKQVKAASYLAIPYIGDDDLGAVLNSAHIVISRAGANTIWELAALAKVSILVPLPIAGANEQEENAKLLEKAGSAIVINQKDLTPQGLIKTIEDINKNYQLSQRKAHDFSKILNINAAKTLKVQIMQILKDD